MLTLNRSVRTCLAIGLAQGLLLWLASALTEPGLQFALATAVLVGGINLVLLGPDVRQRGTAWLVLGLTLVMSAISAWVYWEGGDSLRSSSWLTGTWVCFAVVITYIVTAFILSWPSREGRFPRYEDLFRHAWDTVFIVLLGLLLNGVFWALLLLWGSLFKMLGIVALNQLFSTTGFICISSMMVFALGLQMGRDNDRVIGLLRGILLTKQASARAERGASRRMIKPRRARVRASSMGCRRRCSVRASRPPSRGMTAQHKPPWTACNS